MCNDLRAPRVRFVVWSVVGSGFSEKREAWMVCEAEGKFEIGNVMFVAGVHCGGSRQISAGEAEHGWDVDITSDDLTSNLKRAAQLPGDAPCQGQPQLVIPIYPNRAIALSTNMSKKRTLDAFFSPAPKRPKAEADDEAQPADSVSLAQLPETPDD